MDFLVARIEDYDRTRKVGSGCRGSGLLHTPISFLFIQNVERALIHNTHLHCIFIKTFKLKYKQINGKFEK